MKYIILENDQDSITNEEDILIIEIREENEKIMYKGNQLNYTKEQVKYLYNTFFINDSKDTKITSENVKDNRKKTIVKYISKGYYIVRDILEFFKIIKEKQKEGVQYIYRGQKAADWDLLPSIHRKRLKNNTLSIEDHENKLYKNIQKQNLSEFKRQKLFVNEVIKMQHYGIPSPLLDWTTNPLIALFFAVSLGKFRDNELIGEVDGRIFITNLKEEVCISFDKSSYNEYSNFLERIYTNIKEGKEKFSGDLIFLDTINENNRIRAQRGLFSLDVRPYKILRNSFEEKFLNTFDKIDKEKLLNDEIDVYIELFSYIKKQEKEIFDAKYFYNNFKDFFEKSLKNKFKDNELYKELFEDLITNERRYIEKLEGNFKLEFKHSLKTDSIIILEEDKEKIKKELENMYGIDSYTVYPDLQGYIDYIKENF
ncbi:MAG: FRG domain-containing protein [Fusobacterium mortiferum]|nr:FRG domain-containing protein [Fusobacterium mortiferum]